MIHKILFVFSGFLIITVFGIPSISNPSDSSSFEWDLSFNKVHYWPNVGARCECWTHPPESDSYWLDSWTSDAEGFLWYSPEKYTFRKGDIIATVKLILTTSFPYLFERFDGFYFCGEQYPGNYIAYGWYDIDIYPPHGYDYIFCGIFYDTGIIPDKLLPLELDWASKTLYPTHWLYGGLPLAGRPECFSITN